MLVTDYATKYPQVFPLKSIKTRPIASCLVQLFARVRFPREILTDQGTNFVFSSETSISVVGHS